jgi:predicted transcriptional regulator
MAELKKDHANPRAPILEEEDEATLAAIDWGIQSADEGRIVSLEEVRQRMNLWFTKSSSPRTN